MKPSERIREIFDSYSPNEYMGVKLEHAIIDYLDEQWEKNKTGEQRQYDALNEQQKPCEPKKGHGIIGGTDENGNTCISFVCEKCGKFHKLNR